MENPLKVLKRAPKWAWVTVAGVGIGAIAIKMYDDRGDDAGVTEGTGPGVGGEEGTVVGGGMAGGGGATGIIVPPVINQPNPDAMIPGLDLITGVVSDLSAGWEALLGPIISNQAAINDVVVDAIANAGGPPGAVLGNPTPVTIPVTVTQAPPPAAPTRPGPKPCCLYNGHPLSWWHKASENRRHGRWRWPDGQGFIHTRRFAGHKACDGGGSAGSSKREC